MAGPSVAESGIIHIQIVVLLHLVGDFGQGHIYCHPSLVVDNRLVVAGTDIVGGRNSGNRTGGSTFDQRTYHGCPFLNLIISDHVVRQGELGAVPVIVSPGEPADVHIRGYDIILETENDMYAALLPYM